MVVVGVLRVVGVADGVEVLEGDNVATPVFDGVAVVEEVRVWICVAVAVVVSVGMCVGTTVAVAVTLKL